MSVCNVRYGLVRYYHINDLRLVDYLEMTLIH